MVKLEELKPGDKIYMVSSDGYSMYGDTTVYAELDIVNCPEPTEAVWCVGAVELLVRSYEPYIFRTEKEALAFREEKAKELLESGKFVERLFECATSNKKLCKYSELPIYEIALRLYRENL